MFGNLFSAAKSLADLTDATLGLVVAPVKEGADFIAEGLREFTPEPEDRRG